MLARLRKFWLSPLSSRPVQLKKMLVLEHLETREVPSVTDPTSPAASPPPAGGPVNAAPPAPPAHPADGPPNPPAPPAGGPAKPPAPGPAPGGAENGNPIGNGTLYPFSSSNPQTSINFNESDVLVAAQLDSTNGLFDVWYNDETTLSLGVNQVNVVASSGTTTTTYPLAAMSGNPSVAANPAVGVTPSNVAAGTPDSSLYGVDTSGRPIAPELYITDITNNPNSLSGDWQYGGVGYTPSAVYGAWKGVTETINETGSTPTVTVTPNQNTTQNNWNLGTGSTAPPSSVTSAAKEGYSAEIQWNLNSLEAAGVLQAGHNYRFYVMVHDGDQNKVGGDCGQAAFNETSPVGGSTGGGTTGAAGSSAGPASLAGVVTNSASSASGGVGLAGIELGLFDASGNQIATTTTAADGSYSFTNLSPGTYSIQVLALTQSGNVTASPGTVGGNVDGTTATLSAPSGSNISSDQDTVSITLSSGSLGVNYNFVVSAPVVYAF